MRNNLRHALVSVVAFVTLVLSATCSLAEAQEKSKLDEHYVLGRVRVFFTRTGTSAVAPADVDKSGVPDQVENVAKQVWAAHKLFCEVLDFPDPFESERYKGVTCIQISLRHRNEINGVNGVAFESAQRAISIPEGKPDDRTLVMAVSTQLDPIKNITPAHEMFHLIQYGTNYFKNSWYLEGMDRWSEHGLAKEGIGEIKYSPKGPWPQKLEHLQQIPELGSKCESVLWNPIAARTDRKGLLTNEMLGDELATLRYSDGSPVLMDRLLIGPAVMRDILIELDKQDDIAFKELGYESWTEENQRAPENSPYIYKAIMDALRRHAPPVGTYEVPAQLKR